MEGFFHRLEELGVANVKSHVWRQNLNLMRWLMAPPTTDSVWRFVLRNAYQPELFARRRFRFVAGNPPWLAYRYIKRPDYQKRVRDLVFEYELLGRKQPHLITQMELATLFFAFAADRYLAKHGTLAFVMPRSVMTGAKQHAQFRKQHVAGASCLVDCERVTPLFNVPTCVVISSGLKTRSTVGVEVQQPLVRVSGQLSVRNAALARAYEELEFTDGEHAALDTMLASPYWQDIINGATVYPHGLWFVSPPASVRVIDRKKPQLETDPATIAKAKKPWQDLRLAGNVEAEFLYATLLSQDLLPFAWRKLSLIVVPSVPASHGKTELIDQNGAIRRGKPGLADWLRKADKEWVKRRKSTQTLLKNLDTQKKLTRQHPNGVVKLLYNKSGSHLCSCVVDLRDGSELTAHGVSARGFLAENGTYWFECANLGEAHFLSALLNAPSVDKAIKPLQTKGAFGAHRGGGERDIHRRPFEVLPIPRFEASDKRHRRLAGLSERCHAMVAKAVAEADEKWLKAPVGRVRTELRQGLLKDELKAIDGLVAEILKAT